MRWTCCCLMIGFGLLAQGIATANTQLPWHEIRTQSHTYLVQVANFDQERQQGLMDRKYLMPHQGMLFVFDQPGYYSFWMKNTFLSLDFLWLDSHKCVVHMIERATPQSMVLMTTPQEAQYVIELLAGQIQSKNLKRGDIWQWGDVS